jgi:hypothetical protein
MIRIGIRKLSALLLFTLAVASVFVFPAETSFAQTAAKKVVKTQDDLPRFNYAITGTVTALLNSDDATFNVFAAKVQGDVDSVLNDYDIQDRATLRGLLGVRLQLQLLTGNQDKDALETLAKIHELEDKPDAKLLSGLQTKARIEARMATGQSSGAAYEQAFAKSYAASLKRLPWSIVGNRIKENKSSAEIVTPALVLGSVNASMEPAVAKTHQLSNDLAWELIGDRVVLKQVLPLRASTVAVLTQEVAANNMQKPDIWEAREVTLTEADKLTPVKVAIWDSGSDLSLFTGRVYTDPHRGPQGDPHDLAFDLKGFPTHGYLLPLDGQRRSSIRGCAMN